jgi:hypothetical protein
MARDALFQAKIGEALGHVVKGAAELVGIKEKTGEEELQAKREVKPRKTTPATPVEDDAHVAQE